VLCLATAYVNGQRQGLLQEKPFRMGDTIAKELGSSSDSSSEHNKNAVLDIEEEIKLAFHSRRHYSEDSAASAQEMKDLGLERYV
jgi:alcohol-forming fatty acyl-CoA reductase